MPRLHHMLPWLLVASLVTPVAAQAQSLDDAESGPVMDLLNIFDQARDNDPTLRGQRFELEYLQEQRREQLGRLLPQVSASGTVNRTRRDQTQSGLGGDQQLTRDFTMQRYGVNLRQPLIDMPAWYTLQRGETEVTRGEAELEAARQELVARVAEAYLNVLDAQAGLELARNEREAVEANLERVTGLFEEHMVARADLEEVRARLDRSRAAVIRAEGELHVARERLAEITNSHHYHLASLSEEASLPPLEPADPAAWVEQAMQSNPMLKAGRQRVNAAEDDIRTARAGRYPSVDLVASYSYLDDLDGTAFGREYEDTSIGLQMEVPLYMGGSTSARARGAVQVRNREREALESTRRAIRADIRAAYQAVLSMGSEIEALDQFVRSSERRLEAVDAGFGAGLRPLSDVLDAQSELFSARRDLSTARHDYLIHLLELRRSAGQLSEADIIGLNNMLVH